MHYVQRFAITVLKNATCLKMSIVRSVLMNDVLARVCEEMSVNTDLL